MTAVEQVVGIENGVVTAPEGSLVAMVRSHAVMLQRQVDQAVLIGGVRSTLDEHSALLKDPANQLTELRADVREVRAGQDEWRAEVAGLRSETRRIIEMLTDLTTGEFSKK